VTESSLRAARALVTGASRGIGLEIARALAAEDVRLVLTSRGGPALASAAKMTGGTPVAADLGRTADLERVVERVRAEFGGPPDILVNDAGVFELALVSETTPEAFDRHLDINVRAPFRLVRAFLPAMLERGSGHLIHIGSVAGRQAFPENGAYCASKFALRGLHEVLRLELEGSGVMSTLISPGAVDTGAWTAVESRLGRDLPDRAAMLRPEGVAAVVLDALRLGRKGRVDDVEL